MPMKVYTLLIYTYMNFKLTMFTYLQTSKLCNFLFFIKLPAMFQNSDPIVITLEVQTSNAFL